MFLTETTTLKFKSPLFKIIQLSSAFENTYILMVLRDFKGDESILHMNSSGQLIKQYSLRPNYGFFSMLNSSVLGIPLLEDFIMLIELKTETTRHLLFDFKPYSESNISLYSFLESSLICLKQSQNKRKLSLTFISNTLSAFSNEDIQYHSYTKQKVDFDYIGKANNRSLVAYCKRKQYEELEITFVDWGDEKTEEIGGKGREEGGKGREEGGKGREEGGKGREKGGKGREKGGKGREKGGKVRERHVKVRLDGVDEGIGWFIRCDHVWQTKRDQMMIIGVRYNDIPKHMLKINKKPTNIYMLSLQDSTLRQSNFQLPFQEFQSWTGPIYSLYDFTIVCTLLNEFKHPPFHAKEYYINNKQERIQSVKYYLQDFSQKRYEAQSEDKIIKAIFQNHDVRDVAITQIKTYQLKNVWMHMLLHLQGDFDDDLLFDALELIDCL